MGVAAFVLGIISIIFSCIPACNYFFIIPALIGLILGIVDIISKIKNKGKKGIGIAGMILSLLALIIIVGETILLVILGISFDNGNVNNWTEDLEKNNSYIEYNI